MWDQFLLPQVALFGAIQLEDGGRRTNGHAGPGIARATAQCRGFQRVDARGFQRKFRGDFRIGVHVGQRWRDQQAGLGIEFAEFFPHFAHVSLFTSGIEVMATGLERCFNSGQAEIDEGTDGVANHLGTPEGFRQCFDRVFGLNDFIGGGLQTHHALRHHFVHTPGVARHGGEWNVLIDQPVHGQHAGVATGAIDNYGVFSHFRVSLVV